MSTNSIKHVNKANQATQQTNCLVINIIIYNIAKCKSTTKVIKIKHLLNTNLLNCLLKTMRFVLLFFRNKLKYLNHLGDNICFHIKSLVEN